ncbi:MAG: hypothetical protein HY286_06275 [Planctomycetes bacterium]|nr:hypothetical protein [Planctomycetota bacterium]
MMKDRAVLLLILAGAVVAACLREPFAVNAAAWAGILYVASARCRGGAGADLPLPRRNRFEYLVPAAAAALVAVPTLILPFLSDDYALLSGRGALPDLWSAIQPDGDLMFYRPVGWALWWVFGKYDISAPPVRALAVAVFAAGAALAAPALRRLGFRRGTAVWAATLFALHPFALETVAWPANLYSLLSFTFAAAALAAMPSRRMGVGRASICAIFTFLACFSKEDAFLWLPAAALAGLSRFQFSRAGRALKLAWPVLVSVILAFAIRWWALGGIGGYKEPGTGAPWPLWRYERGFEQMLRFEFPSYYLVPARVGNAEARHPMLLSLMGIGLPALFAFVTITKNARRAFGALFICGIAMALPVCAMLPAGSDLAGARLLYPFSFILCAVATTAIASSWLPRMSRIIIYIALAASMVVIGMRNFRTWEKAGTRMVEGTQLMSDALAQSSAPGILRVTFLGMPDSINGVVCFRNAIAPIGRMLKKDAALIVHDPGSDLGRMSHVYYADFNKQSMRMLPDAAESKNLAAGESLKYQFDGIGLDRAAVRALSLVELPSSDGWALRSRYYGSGLLIPGIRTEPNTKIQLTIETAYASGDAPAIIVTRRAGPSLDRASYRPGDWMPVGEGALCALELRLPPGSEIHIKSLSIAREK